MSQSVAPDVRWVAVGGAPLLTFLVALTGAMLARACAVPPGGPLPLDTCLRRRTRADAVVGVENR